MIFNLGSINADYFYQVPHIPAPGETLASTGFCKGLGGKGANQSVAIAMAGGSVRHIGAVGPDGDVWLDRMAALGVGTQGVVRINTPTAHAIITVAADGENAITLYPGANRAIPQDHIDITLTDLGSNDWLLLQNETNGQAKAAQIAKDKGAKVAYSAAPFDPDATKSLLPLLDLLVVNEGEAAALKDTLGLNRVEDVPVPKLLMTLGAKGSVMIDGDVQTFAEAPKVAPVDTTGAGDTFLGYFMAATDAGEDIQTAMQFANKAAALKVTRPGTADAIPSRAEVETFDP